jgi:hypothetical protein
MHFHGSVKQKCPSQNDQSNKTLPVEIYGAEDPHLNLDTDRLHRESNF